jgi:hypothetical protein
MRWVGLLGLMLALAITAMLARQQLAATVALPAQAGSAVPQGGLPQQVQGEVDAVVQGRVRELQRAGEGDKP